MIIINHFRGIIIKLECHWRCRLYMVLIFDKLISTKSLSLSIWIIFYKWTGKATGFVYGVKQGKLPNILQMLTDCVAWWRFLHTHWCFLRFFRKDCIHKITFGKIASIFSRHVCTLVFSTYTHIKHDTVTVCMDHCKQWFMLYVM